MRSAIRLARLYIMVAAESLNPAHPAHEYFVQRYRDMRALLVQWMGVLPS